MAPQQIIQPNPDTNYLHNVHEKNGGEHPKTYDNKGKKESPILFVERKNTKRD